MKLSSGLNPSEAKQDSAFTIAYSDINNFQITLKWTTKVSISITQNGSSHYHDNNKDVRATIHRKITSVAMCFGARIESTKNRICLKYSTSPTRDYESVKRKKNHEHL